MDRQLKASRRRVEWSRKGTMTENELSQAKNVHPERLVRDYLKANPDARPADVVLRLEQAGVEVTIDAVIAILAATKTG